MLYVEALVNNWSEVESTSRIVKITLCFRFHLKMRSGGLLRVQAGILSPGVSLCKMLRFF